MANHGTQRKHLHTAHKKRQDTLEYFAYFFSIATPLFEVPQAWQIYAHHDARNVSLTTWSFFCIDNLVWMVYAVKKRTWPLLLTSVLYEVIEIAIVIGILKYS